MGLAMACYGGLQGILTGLTKSTDHPSKDHGTFQLIVLPPPFLETLTHKDKDPTNHDF